MRAPSAMTTFAFAALLAGLLAACGPKPPPGPASKARVIVHMKRDGCLGECPVYEVTIYEDGVVQFDGQYFTKVKGRRTRTITTQALDELSATFVQLGFASWGNFNEIECYDMPGATITFLGHTVDHAYGDADAPDEVIALENIVDDVAGTDEWVGPRGVPGGFYCP